MFQADGIIDQGDISKLLEAHKKYDNSFIVSPTLFDKDKNPSVNSGCFPEKELEKTTFILDGDICAETVLGSIIMFKRKDIIEIGLFDENFFLYFLDDDLCKRVRNKKKAVIQVSNSNAIHAHGQIKVQNHLKRTFIRNFNLPLMNSIIFLRLKNTKII